MCRFRSTTDIVPDSVQFRFCTLPDVDAASPFAYADTTRTVNGYYNVFGVPTIRSQHKTKIAYFDDFTVAKNDWRSTQVHGLEFLYMQFTANLGYLRTPMKNFSSYKI